MLCGYFSASGVGPIVCIQEKMNAADYREILKDKMLPFAEDKKPLKWEFIKDNNPKHSDRSVKSWLQQNEVPVMEWPSQSPDLNPTEEHLWGVFKKKIGNFKSRNK